MKMKKIILSFVVLVLLSTFSCKTDVSNTQEADTKLKTLVIRRSSGLAKTISPVPFNYTHNLKKDITSENPLIIEATASDSNATIHFDREASPKTSKEYKAYKPKVVIVVKNGGFSSTYTISIERPKAEISLQSLIVKQGEIEVKSFNEPVSMTNSVKLTKIIDGLNYLTVEAKPKDTGTNVYFDGENISRTKKYYTSFQSQIKIKLQKDQQIKEYTLTIENVEDKAGMQRFVVRQNDVVLKDINSDIPKVINVDLRDKVSSSEFVMIEVTPKENQAEVFFDGILNASKTKKYENYQKIVKILIKKDGQETEYSVNLREPEIAEPQNYSVKCNVVDSMGGTNVEGANIKAYEEGSSTFTEEKTTDREGNAYFSLAKDKYYNFVISKNGWAGSRVETVYVPLDKRLFLPIVMRNGEKGALAIAPEITKLSIRNSGVEKALNKNHEIDFLKLTAGSVLNITVSLKSKKIIPEVNSDSKNFGIAMNINSPLSNNSDGVIFPSKVPNGSGNTIIIETDGSITQNFSVPLNKLAVENGNATLYFVVYDTAGNRCERHQKVTFKNATLKQTENLKNQFATFNVYSERYYRSLQTFGMPKENECETSAKVIFKFKFDNKTVDVGRLDVLRRPYQEGSPTENWEVVYTKHYEKNFRGDSTGEFKVSDDSGDLRDGQVYQYKLEAYNSNGKMSSNIATIKVMEAFNIVLTTPKNRCEIPLSNIGDQDFAFNISKKSLWTDSDYFYFDVLLHAEDIYTNGTNIGLMFAAMLKYNLGKNKDLEVAKYDQWNINRLYKSYTHYNPQTTNLDDLVKYADGTVTLTNKFFKEASFNVVSKTLSDSIRQAGMYYWDIMYIGKNPLGVYDLYGNFDDKAAFFVKEYPYLDSRTGKPVGTEKSLSYSYSNLDIIGGAVNGKALFIVK